MGLGPERHDLMSQETHAAQWISFRQPVVRVARERLGDRVRYCARLAVTPYVRDWAVLPLPGAMSPLYYLIRPFRMIGRYAAAALRRE